MNTFKLIAAAKKAAKEQGVAVERRSTIITVTPDGWTIEDNRGDKATGQHGINAYELGGCYDLHYLHKLLKTIDKAYGDHSVVFDHKTQSAEILVPIRKSLGITLRQLDPRTVEVLEDQRATKQQRLVRHTPGA